MARSNAQAIIIRKMDDMHSDAAHGGAWKVAYADFMTAMMAFFLLMWIISNATKEQLNGVADYFTPAKVSMTAKGGSGALGGTTLGPQGIMNQSNGAAKPVTDQKVAKPGPNPPMAVAKEAAPQVDGKTSPPAKDANGKPTTVVKVVSEHALDKQRFDAVQKELVQAIKAEPDLRPLMKNVLFRQTPDGLQIELVDQAGRAMFASGSAKVEGPTLLLMEKLARVIATFPNKLKIAGHTDSVPYAEGAGHDNWELSSERANATRRVLVSNGVASDQITSISGLADTDPLKPADPSDPSNRRITVLLTYQKGQDTSGLEKAAAAAGVSLVAPKAPAAAPAETLPAPEAPASSAGLRQTASVEPTPAAAPVNAIAAQYSLITPADLAKH